MGTRHLTMVYKDGDYRVAQYGQWDGYPEGQGKTILNFLREKFERGTFEKHLAESQHLDPEQVEKMWEEHGADGSGFVTTDVAREFSKAYPSLSRDTGAYVLNLIQEGPVPLHLDMLFINDSLFCEWAYVIDLDKNTFEVYQGFNLEPLDEDERFFNPESEKQKAETDRENFYYPVRHLRTWALDDVPGVDMVIMQLRIIGCRYADEYEALIKEYGQEQVDYYRREEFKPAPLRD